MCCDGERCLFLFHHTYMSDLLVAGGGDAGLGFVRPLQPVRPPAALLLRPLALALVMVLVLVLALVLALALLEVLVRHAGLLHLGLPEATLPQEALVHLQLLARLLPTVAALHLQLLDAHLDVLDVVCRDPRSGEEQKKIEQNWFTSSDSWKPED